MKDEMQAEKKTDDDLPVHDEEGLTGLTGQDAEHLRKAEEWFIVAAQTGGADAECVLGTRYAQGAFGVVDYVKAKEWWEKAAEQDNLIAMENLGDMYQRGEEGVPQDRRRAFAWFERAAEAGVAHGDGTSGSGLFERDRHDGGRGEGESMADSRGGERQCIRRVYFGDAFL